MNPAEYELLLIKCIPERQCKYTNRQTEGRGYYVLSSEVAIAIANYHIVAISLQVFPNPHDGMAEVLTTHLLSYIEGDVSLQDHYLHI